VLNYNLHNPYNYETTEDAIYQLLNLVEHHHVDLKYLKALVSGHIDDESATWKELRKYILDIYA